MLTKLGVTAVEAKEIAQEVTANSLSARRASCHPTAIINCLTIIHP